MRIVKITNKELRDLLLSRIIQAHTILRGSNGSLNDLIGVKGLLLDGIKLLESEQVPE